MVAAVLALLIAAQPAGPAPVRFVEDDWARALAQAKARDVPLFVDAWAPW